MPLSSMGRWFSRESAHFALALGVIVAAGFVFTPTLTRAADDANRASLSDSLGTIRATVHKHRGSKVVRTAESGWPAAINPAWFPDAQLPRHPLTGESMRIEVVEDSADAIAPREKTYASGDPNARHLWYNVANGALCVRVPVMEAQWTELQSFNEVNGLALTKPSSQY